MTNTLCVTFIFLVTIFIRIPVRSDWDDNEDYQSHQKSVDPWMTIFLVIFFCVGSIGACIGCYCRFCGGADRYYGEPVRYVGRGVYIPERLVAQEGQGHVNQGIYGRPYDPTTQPYEQPYPQPIFYGQPQQYPPSSNQPHIIHIN